MNIKDLIKQIPTDCSGKWVNVRDLPDFTKQIIEHCLKEIDDPTYLEKIKQNLETKL